MWVICSALSAAGLFFCVQFVDRPVATLAYNTIGPLPFFNHLAGSPSLFGPLALIIAAIFCLRRIFLRPLAYIDGVLLHCEFSLLTAKLIVATLKILFGRSWPLYADQSFLLSRAYEFRYFNGEAQYASFPSGHAASISALIVVLWEAYPQFRTLYTISIVALAATLVAGNFHFVSDVAAGCLVGGAVGGCANTAFKTLRRSNNRKDETQFSTSAMGRSDDE
jgi:membrane-associated phospholipid phosphatase